LVSGYNFIGLKVEPTDEECNPITITTKDILDGVPGAVKVIRWKSDIQDYEDSFYFFGEVQNPFDIELGQGYFIQVEDDTTWTVLGKPIESPVEVFFVIGYTSIAIPYSDVPLTSKNLLDDIPAEKIIRWRTDIQDYEESFYFFGEVQNPFDIENDRGYFVKVDQDDLTWPPGGVSAAPLLTNVESIPSRKPPLASTPEIMRETVGNITSAAATISWYTDFPSDGVVYYGTNGVLDAVKVEKRKYSQSHLVTLTGLKPNTTYYYQVSSGDNYSSYRTFTTAGFGLGIPYTICGQMYQSDGKTPASDQLVYVTVNNGIESSIPLVALTNIHGFWTVEFGNLKTNNGQVFKYQIGDNILVQSVNFQYADKINGDPIQSFGRHLLPSQDLVRSQMIPQKPILYQNYPNPFNPETWIPYQLSQSADVNIIIYNAAGQVVRELELTQQPAGLYLDKDKAAYWNGKNQSGERVASGIYFYTIRAGDFTATQKMILLK
jgi:hypothetical protein